MKRMSLLILIALSSIQFCFADRLSSAIYDGDLEKVKSCIEEQGIDINRLENKTSPLWDAIYYLSSKQGSPEGIEIVKYLISKGADINYSYKNFFKGNINASCLDYVIYESKTPDWKNYYTELFNILYENGARISDYSLRWAVNAANGMIIDTLVNSGKLNKTMYTDGLYWTVNNIYVENRFSGDIQVNDGIRYIELFVKNGADINYKSSSGLSPLMMSVTMFSGDVDTRIMKCLIDNGADINTTDKDGNTVLMNCSFEYYNYYKDKIELYLNSNPDLNIKNKYKKNAISKLISTRIGKVGSSDYDNTEDMNNLFEKFIDLGAKFSDIEVDTPFIILAAKYDHKDIAKYLIAIGVDVNIKDKKGKDALFYAYETEDSELIDMIKNHESLRQSFLEEIKAEQEKREDINKLSDAIKNKDFNYLNSTMKKYYLIPDNKISNGKSIYENIFECFLKDGDSRYLDFLRDTRNYTNVQIDFNEDEQLWYYSIDSYSKRIDDFYKIPSEKVSKYLKKQIDSKFSENFNRIKSKKSKEKIFYSYIDSNFDSVLIYAIRNDEQKTANVLINKHLVDLSYTNKEGKTALDYAKELGLKSIIKSIEKNL